MALGESSHNDLFSAIVVQRVQRFAPPREFATQEFGLAACGIFVALGVECLQKKHPLRHQSVDRLRILH